MSRQNFQEYKVWDLPTRLFHWVNVVSIMGLIFVATIMMFKKELGITGLEAKIALKEVHIIIGYVFTINLLWRIIWGFMGGKYSRWSAIIPSKGYLPKLKNYLTSIKLGKPQTYLGHNPLGRLAVTAMIALMLALMLSGLIRAGTDVYYPPFGGAIAQYIADENTPAQNILPYNKQGTDPQKLAQVDAMKDIAGEVHEIAAFTLMFIILLHIFIVVRMEVREEGRIISAMFSGKKIVTQKPEDLN